MWHRHSFDRSANQRPYLRYLKRLASLGFKPLRLRPEGQVLQRPGAWCIILNQGALTTIHVYRLPLR